MYADAAPGTMMAAMGIDALQRFAVAQGLGPQYADRDIARKLVSTAKPAATVRQAPGSVLFEPTIGTNI
jgi:hypothetical protein